MSRRRFIQLSTATLASAVLCACTGTEKENSSMTAEEILDAAGLTTPDLDVSVTDTPTHGDEEWSKLVTFTGTDAEVEAWVADNFANGIESRAYKDDMAAAVERLGEGVQKEGDRIANGADGSIVALIVVGQGEKPEVHVAVRRTGR